MWRLDALKYHMGKKRTLLAWLAVLGLSLLPYSTNAQNSGSGPEERAIRHDLPTILAENVHIDAVSVNADGDHALVQWHVGTTYRIGVLAEYLNVWWLKHQIWIDADGSASCCGGATSLVDRSGPTTKLL